MTKNRPNEGRSDDASMDERAAKCRGVFWSTRRESLAALETKLAVEGGVVYESFAILQDAIESFGNIQGDKDAAHFFQLAAGKGWNYLCGAFSLMLDGLGQEAGALLRPSLEALNLMAYLRMPGAISEARESRLPVAGVIASRVKSALHEPKKHLNKYSAHLSLDSPATDQLIDSASSFRRLRLIDRYDQSMFPYTLAVVGAVALALSSEIVQALHWLKAKPSTKEALANRLRKCGERAEIVFPFANDPPL